MTMEEFGYGYSRNNISHKCCNVCAVSCKCGDGSISFVTRHDESTWSSTLLAESSVVRSVTANEKAELKQLLITYKKKLIEQDVQGMTSTFGVPNAFVEFGWLQIIQIIQTCHKLFTVEDVLKNVEIWRKTHAVAVLDAVAVFGDITIEHEMSMLAEDHQIDIEMDWEEIRNDSSFCNQSFESYAFQFDETETTIESNKDGNDS